MPKSRRAKVVSLTKVKKRPREKKDAQIEEIRELASKHKRLVLVGMENVRNNFLQEMRAKLRPSRLACGKNKLMQLSLGTAPSTECEDGIHKLAMRMGGHCALLFTDKTLEEVRAMFEEFKPMDFARCGAVATDTVKLPKGLETLAKLPHSIEPHLRQLGMPTQLKDGKVVLLGDYVVCNEGQELKADAAQILKLLEIKQARFTLSVRSIWDRESGKVQTFEDDNGTEDDDDDEEEEDGAMED